MRCDGVTNGIEGAKYNAVLSTRESGVVGRIRQPTWVFLRIPPAHPAVDFPRVSILDDDLH